MISSHRIFKTTENEYILHKIHEKLTPDICKALHFLWGFDQTGKFPGYSKKSFWVVFVTVTNKIKALTNLGSSVADIKSLKLFATQLYCRHKIHPNILDLATLRCLMFFGFAEITSKQRSISTKTSSSTLNCSPVKIISPSFAIVARSGILRL